MKEDENKIFNHTHTKAKRKHLRNNMTQAEIVLWSALKGRKLCGMKFRHQHGVGNYVLDFYCPQLNLAVEVDGESHYFEAGKEHDKKRTQFLGKFEIKVIRFTNPEILTNLEGVLKVLEDEIKKRKN